MRRSIAFLLLLIAMFALFGCSNTTGTATANFYYCTTDPQYHTQTSVIQAEQRKIETNLSDMEGILQLYMDGPVSGKLTSPFPAGTVLKAVQPGREVTDIVLSDEIAALSGIDLMVACACLATTVLEISQSEVVQIRAESALLNNQEFIEFTSQSLLSLF